MSGAETAARNRLKDLASVVAVIEKGKRFLLTTHVHPDGDGLGSELALFHFLRALGKEVHVINSSRIPENLRFLDPNGVIEIYRANEHDSIIASVDYVFVIDIGDFERLRALGEVIRRYGVPTVCLDHHPLEADMFGTYYLDTSVCATGELIYDIMKEMGSEVTPVIAEALYTAIMTDTGSYRFSNTNRKAHLITAELIEKGVKPERINFLINEQNSRERISLLSRVLGRLHYESGGRFVWCTVRDGDFADTGAGRNELDGVADMLRSIKGVQVSCVAIEIKESLTKLSFRSKNGFDVNKIARKFKGGGHMYAAGTVLQRRMDEVLPEVVEEIKLSLKNTRQRAGQDKKGGDRWQ